MLQRALYIRNNYEFTLPWKYSRLEPMDVVTLTEPEMGMFLTPVRLTAVEEDDTGNLKMTAEDFFTGTLTTGNFEAPTTNAFVPNQNVSPGNANPPVIFQPPVEFTGQPQVWLATAGGANWGGAEVWASNDNVSYSKMGVVSGPARYGTLTANFPSGGDPDTINTLSANLSASAGTLSSVTTAQANGLATISYVGGELLSYANANLTSPFNYGLTYLRRGTYGTESKAHLTGTQFVRLDGAVMSANLDPSLVGTTIYIKLLSYNTTSGGQQELADVSAHSYVVQPTGIVVTNGSVPYLIGAGQYFYIAPGTQVSVANRMYIYGRLKCYGRLVVN